MDHVTIIEQGQFLTNFLAPASRRLLYSVESWRHPQGWWSSSILRTDPTNGSGEELANVTYLDWSNTRVTFGTRNVDLNAFLPRSGTTSNSRTFIGPNGQTYKWRIKGKNLELYQHSSHTPVARFHASHKGLLSRKPRNAWLEMSHKRLDPEILDAVVVTLVIMEHLLRDRRKYSHAPYL